jgi:hypothetical protein
MEIDVILPGGAFYNSWQFFQNILSVVLQKKIAGFKTSMVDFWGIALGQHFLPVVTSDGMSISIAYIKDQISGLKSALTSVHLVFRLLLDLFQHAAWCRDAFIQLAQHNYPPRVSETASDSCQWPHATVQSQCQPK